MVCAPPMTSTGIIHRDLWWNHTQQPHSKVNTVFTILLCVTDVTEANGCVELWRDTSHQPHDQKNPRRAITNMNSQLLTASAGQAIVFDSLLLHQSLKNSTIISMGDSMDGHFQIEYEQDENGG
jgi:ectoine hydroxylase-related dioxygenase (phytanoyl-CoA dioxygenase family)